MAKTIENLFFYSIYVFDLLIVVQTFLIFQKKGTSKILWLLLAGCCVNSFCNLVQSYIPKKEDEYLFLVCFTTIEYFIFAGVFSQVIKGRNFRKCILVMSCIFLAVVIFNYDQANAETLDSVPIGVETILILIYSFYYLYEQMNIVDATFIYHRFHFWVVTGIMIYLSGSFFIYILANQVDYATLGRYWFLTWVVYLIKDIFLCVGLYRYAKSPTMRAPKKLSLV
jgi:hypothetical protein